MRKATYLQDEVGPKPTAPWQQRRGKWALSPLNITGCLAKCHQSLRMRFVWCCHRCTALRALAGLPNSRYVLRPNAVRRKAQACGPCSPSSAQALLGSQSVCGIGYAEAARASVRRCRAVITKYPRPPCESRRFAACCAGVARPPPKGVPSTRRYPALPGAVAHGWSFIAFTPQLAMRCKPSKSVCTADSPAYFR